MAFPFNLLLMIFAGGFFLNTVNPYSGNNALSYLLVVFTQYSHSGLLDSAALSGSDFC